MDLDILSDHPDGVFMTIRREQFLRHDGEDFYETKVFSTSDIDGLCENMSEHDNPMHASLFYKGLFITSFDQPDDHIHGNVVSWQRVHGEESQASLCALADFIRSEVALWVDGTKQKQRKELTDKARLLELLAEYPDVGSDWIAAGLAEESVVEARPKL